MLPFLFDEEEGDKLGDYGDATTKTRTHTHEDYVRGAEECLMIEDEMDQLEEEDSEYLDQLEREALADDPEIVAEVIADVLKQDDLLLKEMASKLVESAPEVVKEMEGMLGEGEKLEERPDVVGYIIAKLLSEGEENFDLLESLDLLEPHDIAELVEDWSYEEDTDVGEGDEL